MDSEFVDGIIKENCNIALPIEFALRHFTSEEYLRIEREVLSPSTQSFDRGEKRAHYQTIETLTDYLMIAQDAPRVTHCFRRDGGAWQEEEVTGLDASLEIDSVGCVLRLADVYDRVTWTP